MTLRLDTLVTGIDVATQRLSLREKGGCQTLLDYDERVVGTGALPVRPPIGGLDDLGAQDGVHLLHSMGDTFALTESLDRIQPRTALIVGAGYVGLEIAEGLTMRGIAVTQVEMLPEVLPTVDVELGALVHAELERHGVRVHTRSTVTRISRTGDGRPGRVHVDGVGPNDAALNWDVDLVLVVVGVTPDTDLLIAAGAQSGPRGAVVVDEMMATGLPRVWAAGDCVVTPTTACSESRTCRWEQPRARRAASPGRTHSVATRASPAASAPRLSRCSTLSPHVRDCGTMTPAPPATPR